MYPGVVGSFVQDDIVGSNHQSKFFLSFSSASTKLKRLKVCASMTDVNGSDHMKAVSDVKLNPH